MESRVTPTRGDIAIVGMSCILPGASNLQQYWQNIVSKVDALGDPPEQWGAEYFYDPDSTSNDRIYCKRGGYLKDLAKFNPLQFGVVPSSIDGAEPGHFLALRAAYESLADAGYSDKPVDGARVEVILGKGAQFGPADVNAIQHGIVIDQTLRILKQLHPEHSSDELESIKKELKAGLAPFNAETVPGLVSSIVTGRINNRLDFMGANYTVDAACASSLVAVERGIHDLLAGRCDMALVGGIEPCIPPLMLMVFCQINALSRKGRIRPFDKNAGGTLLGEGVGIVALKRQEDAERDGDRIYALIKGVGVSSDGRGAGLLAPRLEGEALAIERAYEESAIDTRTVGLIEAHGTGVPLGDATEVRALGKVFGPRRGSNPTCALGSVKSMVSHLVHAAGVAGLIKTALALYHKVLPPTLNCEEVNPELEIERTPFYLNTETRPWIHGANHPRRAGVSAFGFGGINAHAVLEEYSTAEAESENLAHTWETEVFILRDESREELIASCRRLKSFISLQPEIALKDLAYSLNCALQRSGYRVAIVADSLADLSAKLERAITKLSDPKCARVIDRNGIYFFEQPLSREGTLAFMFPGYGSEYVNMLSDLCIHFPEVRAHFDSLDKASLRSNREVLPSQILFPPPLDGVGADSSQEEVFSRMAFESSAMCTADLALLDLLTRLEILPDAVVGHSNGEFAALLAAGAITIQHEDQFLEHALRAQSIFDSIANQIPSAKVLAVGGGDPGIVASLLRQSDELQLTIDNCPHQVVLCGPANAIDSAYDYLQKRGVICNLMPFSHAVHSPSFQPICDQIAAVHHDLEISLPKIAAYSCTTARLHPADQAEIRQLIMNHLARPVRFRETIEEMYKDGVRIFVEIGPKAGLTGFVNDILGDRRFIAVPSNTTNRSGITQLNHMVGLLASHHVPMRLDYLYRRRSPERVSFDATREAHNRTNQHGTVRLSLEYPLLKLQNDREPARDTLQYINRVAADPTRSAKGHSVRAGDQRESAVEPSKQNGKSLPIEVQRASKSVGTGFRNGILQDSRSVVMDGYFHNMDRFLELQQTVVERFLAARGNGGTKHNGSSSNGRASHAQPKSAAHGPFRIVVQSFTEGRELTAVCHLDLTEHRFLRDHTVGRSPSTLDESLMALTVVPLTINMEIMAQAASLLAPGKRLIGMKNLRSSRWIEVDERGCLISLSARVRGGKSPSEIEVKMVLGAQASCLPSSQGATCQAAGRMPALPDRMPALPDTVEGIMEFGDEYPESPGIDPFSCDAEQTYHLRPEQYYDSMFHGPSFRSVVSIDKFDRKGMQATLRTPPNARLFKSFTNAGLLTDPVLLDGAGQVIGFWTWTLDGVQEEAATFPVGFESLKIYAPFDYGGDAIKCNARVSSFADRRTSSDIDLIGPRGNLLARLVAWEDMRSLGWTPLFNQFILSPRDVMYSTVSPASSELKCCTVSDGPGGMWPHVLASTILNREERQIWADLELPERKRREWLLGRLAAKDAARLFIKSRCNLSLCPADIGIVTDPNGRESIAPLLAERIGCGLTISISHSAGKTTAIVGSEGFSQ